MMRRLIPAHRVLPGVLMVLGFVAADSCAAAEKASDAYGQATASPLAKAPVIDGRIEPGEWDGAVRTTGFQTIFSPGGFLEPRTGTTYFGFTAERLYLAVVSEYPPDGKDHSSGVGRDRDYVMDESIEIWLDPNRKNRAGQAGDLRFYQMNANARGGICDIAFDPKTGPNTGWNGHWEMKSTVDHAKHVWTAELSLPVTDIGWKAGQAVGKTIGVLVSRNYKNPWQQTTWFPVLGAFIDWYRYPAIRLTADAPSVQITSLGAEIHKPHLQLRSRIFNPGPARKAKVRLTVTSWDMPEVKGEKLIDLPAAGSAEYAFDDGPNRLHADAQHALLLDVTDAAGGETYMHYGLKWVKAPDKRWHYRIGPDPDAAVRLAYYPSYRFVRVLVDSRELAKGQDDKPGSAVVRISGPGGREVVKQTIDWPKPPCTKELKVGDLPDGEHTLSVAVAGQAEPIMRTFTRKHFLFEGNRLGITDEVLPPFAPVKVDGQRVSVVLREYELDGLGLPRSMKAAGNVSAGPLKELLAGPMALRVDGGAALAGEGRFVQTRPAAAVYEGSAAGEAVTVRTRTITEMDGCMKVELKLQPGTKGSKLGALWLDVPLVDKLMPLWHVSTAGLRINPAGSTPPGRGPIWDSRKFPDGNWYGNFKCYLWVGAEERGFCWFADNDAGWELAVDEEDPDKSVPCQQLIRKDGVLTLRVNLVQKPVTITEPRTIVFGMMATPAKPMSPDWRRREILDRSQFNMGYANPATYCAKAPWGGDFTIAGWCYRRRTGKSEPSKADIEAWKQRNFPQDMDARFRESAINLALGPFFGTFRLGQKYYKMYFEEFHTTAQVEPEAHVFQSEWSGGWQGKLLDHATTEAHKMWGVGVAGIVPSYRDFACWYAAQWVRRGIGCYFDNAFPTRAYDTLTTSAYVLPNGQVQPSAGMWARREYLRRIWTLHRQLAPADAMPVMMIHMTNTHIVPYMVWNDENLDLEWKFGPEPQQSKFPHDFLRAESLGRQSGNVPYVLDKVMDAKTPEDNHRAHRTKFGAMMVHELRWWGWGEDVEAGLIKILKDFGYGQDNCRVWDYWDAGYPVRSSDTEAKTLLLERGGELLLLVCTWKPRPTDVTLTFDLSALGLKPAAAVDAEKPVATLAWDAAVGTLKLPLEGYGVRLVRLR